MAGLMVGASKVGFAGGGGFGGTFMRYALSMIHGYCFGYCVYVNLPVAFTVPNMPS